MEEEDHLRRLLYLNLRGLFLSTHCTVGKNSNFSDMEKKGCSSWESNPGPFIYYILNPNSPKTKYLKKNNLFFNVDFGGIRVQQ